MTAAQLQQTEKQFQQAVVDFGRALGWRVFHPFDARHSEDGFPDLTLARRGRLVFAELKTQNGRVKPEQPAWLAELNGGEQEEYGLTSTRGSAPWIFVMASTAPVCLWRPSDWPEIEAVLR